MPSPSSSQLGTEAHVSSEARTIAEALAAAAREVESEGQIRNRSDILLGLQQSAHAVAWSASEGSGQDGLPAWAEALELTDGLPSSHEISEERHIALRGFESLEELFQEQRGNPFRPGTESWRIFGDRTGMWVGMSEVLYESLGQYGMPGRFQEMADLIDEGRRMLRRGLEVRRNQFLPIDGLDIDRLDWSTGHWEAVIQLAKATVDGLVEVNQTFAQAHRAGAGDTQMGELAQVYSRMKQVDWMSQANRDVQREANGAIAWDDGFWAAMRAGTADVGFGQVMHMLVHYPHSLFLHRVGSETADTNGELRDQATAHNVRAAASQSVDAMRDAMRQMDLDVHGDEDERRDRRFRRLMGVWSDHQAQLARLERVEFEWVAQRFEHWMATTWEEEEAP